MQHGIPDFRDDPKRVIAATVDGVRVLCLYAPNGEAPGTDKYAYKLRWYEALTAWLAHEVRKDARGSRCLATSTSRPKPRDVHDPKRWEGKIHFSEPERAAFREVLNVGLKDAFRLFEPAREAVHLVGLPPESPSSAAGGCASTTSCSRRARRGL